MINSDFIHLHNHTEYSILDGACRVKDIIQTAKTNKMDALAITDHGNLFGSVEFYLESIKQGVRPIIGLEAYVCEDMKVKKSTRKKSGSHHLLLLAKDVDGYKNLLKISSVGFLEGFYYKPRVDKPFLKKHSKGLVCSSACLAGEIPDLICEDRYEDAKQVALEYASYFEEGDFYLELMEHGIPEESKVNEQLIKMSRETKLPLVATNDIHFLKQEHHEAHDILLCIQTGKTLNDEKRMRFNTDEVYFRTQDEMIKLFSHVPQAIENTVEIAKKCSLDLKFGQYLLPHFEIPDKFEKPYDYLRYLVFEGAKLRYGKIDSRIEKRIEFELNVIHTMGFDGYFLITWDFIHYSKKAGIPVGPGRGSAAGSIVAYSLGITDIDPLKYDLLFERFLNPQRVNMPDIDIDFCYEKREKVIDYVKDKYGEDNVCQIVTFGRMKAKAVVRDVGRVMGLPYPDVDKISKLIPGDAKKLQGALDKSEELNKIYENDPTINKLINYALQLEGLPRQPGKHAAGVIIAPKPLVNYVGLYNGKEGVTTQTDMGYVEKLGLLKMDFLGLRTLTVIDHALDLVEKNYSKRIDILNVPLDDKKVFQLLTKGKTVGIFQFESEGMQGYLRKLKPTVFEDMIAMNALYRPGPLGSNMVDTFIHRKHGIEKIEYLTPQLEPILKETYGVIVYQEQVMRIASELGGFSLGEADSLRRAMGKKKEDIMAEFKPKFVEGCEKNGITDKISNDIYQLMTEFAKYGFNKSHSACYALVAYQTAYLKVHYPLEFMAALMSSVMNDTDKVSKFIEECRDMKIKITPPHINKSEMAFTVADNAIVYALGAIKSVGESAINIILSSRKEDGLYHSFFDFIKRVLPGGAAKKNTLEALIYAGVFDEFGNRAQLLQSYERAVETAQKALKVENNYEGSLFDELDLPSNETEVNFKMEEFPEFPLTEKLNKEKEYLGFFISGHPLDRFKSEVECLRGLNLVAEAKDEWMICGGMVTNINSIFTKKNDKMAFVTIEDYSGTLELTVFPKKYEKYEDQLRENELIGCFVRRDTFNDKTTFSLERVFPLDELFNQAKLNLILDLNVIGMEKSEVDEIIGTIEDNPGKTPILIKLVIPAAEKTFTLQSDKYKVAPTSSLLEKLKNLEGDKKVYYCCQP